MGVGEPPDFYSDGIIPPTIGPFNSLDRGSGLRSLMSRRGSWLEKGSAPVGNRRESTAFSTIGRKPTKDISVFGVPEVFGGSGCPPDSSAGGRAVTAGRRGGAAAA